MSALVLWWSGMCGSPTARARCPTTPRKIETKLTIGIAQPTIATMPMTSTPTSVVNAGDGTHEHPTQALLDDAMVDLDEWLAAEVEDAFAAQETQAFINGDGVNKPKGLLSYPTVADAGQAWGQIGSIASGWSPPPGVVRSLKFCRYRMSESLGPLYRKRRAITNSTAAG